MESLQNYKLTAEAYKPEPPTRKQTSDPDSLISFDGKDYISAARAAKVTGYHQDYVGQLARSGTILSRQIGNRWYVERDGILTHKREKDSLLAAVQAESVGIVRPGASQGAQDDAPEYEPSEYEQFTYSSEGNDLLPILKGGAEDMPEEVEENNITTIPIRVIPRSEILEHKASVKHVKPRHPIPGKTISYATVGALALTVVLVVGLGFSPIGKNALYAVGKNSGAYAAAAGNAFGPLGDMLERLVVPELSYRSAN